MDEVEQNPARCPSPVDIEKSVAVAEKNEPSDAFLVVFTKPIDAENPQDWPSRRKWAMTSVLSITGFNRIMVSTIMAPALGTIAAELGMSPVESNMALSVYLLATAFGPLIMGPLSEVYGRQPVLHASSIFFLIFNIACGFANTKELLIAARLLAGLGASSIYALAGGVLGDLWPPEKRGRSLGLYILIPVLGAAVGPIIGGYLTEGATWRWMFWSTSIAQGIMIAASMFVFRETYGPVILHRRAERLRRNTQNPQFQTLSERQDAGRSVLGVLRQSLSRPFRLLLFHPIIQVTSALSAFYYGLLYIVLSTFSHLWTTIYHESVSTSGLHYIACAAGEVTASLIGGSLMDILYRKLKQRNGQDAPEYRVPLILPGALLAPIGFFIYGWAAHYRVTWPVVDVGAFVITFGMQLAAQPIQAYLIDAYPDHTSSAAAASQFVRSMTAFAFPLFAPSLYATLGNGWGNSMLAFVALGLGVPAPILLWVYGARLRARAQSSY